jgi:hypothetical protein
MQQVMCQASRDLLRGFELRADCKPEDIVRYPDRFVDKRDRENGMQRWNRLMALLAEQENERSTDFQQASVGTTAITNKKGEQKTAIQTGLGKVSGAMD